MALQFVNENDLLTVDMGDGDWIKIPARLSFGFVSEFEAVVGTDIEKTAQFLVKLIREWSAKQSDGSMLPITVENVKRLDLRNMTQIMEAVMPLTTLEKKSSTPSV